MRILQDISQHFRAQRARKAGVFTPGGGVDLRKMLDWLEHKGGATGKLIHCKKGSDGKPIASTSRFSGYQTLKQKIGSSSGWREEAGDAANPMQRFLNTVKSRYPNNEAVLTSVEQVRMSMSAYGTRLFDTAQLRAALLVLAPLQEEMRTPPPVQAEPKVVLFAEFGQEWSIPKRTQAQPPVSEQAAACLPVARDLAPPESAPKSTIDLRVAVNPRPIGITRSDWLDANAVLTQYRQNPEREEAPLWTLLEAAREHAAARTESITHPWDLNDAENLQDGVVRLIQTPVLALLRQTNPSEFEAVCKDCDRLAFDAQARLST